MKWFHVDLNPTPWAVGPLATKRVSAKKVIAIMGQNAQLATFKNSVKEQVLAQNPEKFGPDSSLHFVVLVWRRIEEYGSWQARRARSQEADATNMLKAIEDALHEVCYDNDKVNVHVECVIVRQDTDTDPKIIIGIEEVGLDHRYQWVQKVPDSVLNPVKVSAALDPEDAKWAKLRESPDDDF